jgi:hypothetical protein
VANANAVVAKGVEKRVVFDGTTVTIHSDLFGRLRAKVRHLDASDRVLLIDDIVAVDLVASTIMLNGYVRFIVTGEDDERPAPMTGAAGVRVATRDPHAVTFSRYQARAFTALHDAVAAAIADREAR